MALLCGCYLGVLLDEHTKNSLLILICTTFIEAINRRLLHLDFWFVKRGNRDIESAQRELRQLPFTCVRFNECVFNRERY